MNGKTRQVRLYSLFEKQEGKWVRISATALPKAQAIRVFQSALLTPFLGSDVCKGIRTLKVVDSTTTLNEDSQI